MNTAPITRVYRIPVPVAVIVTVLALLVLTTIWEERVPVADGRNRTVNEHEAPTDSEPGVGHVVVTGNSLAFELVMLDN